MWLFDKVKDVYKWVVKATKEIRHQMGRHPYITGIVVTVGCGVLTGIMGEFALLAGSNAYDIIASAGGLDVQSVIWLFAAGASTYVAVDYGAITLQRVLGGPDPTRKWLIPQLLDRSHSILKPSRAKQLAIDAATGLKEGLEKGSQVGLLVALHAYLEYFQDQENPESVADLLKTAISYYAIALGSTVAAFILLSPLISPLLRKYHWLGKTLEAAYPGALIGQIISTATIRPSSSNASNLDHTFEHWHPYLAASVGATLSSTTSFSYQFIKTRMQQHSSGHYSNQLPQRDYLLDSDGENTNHQHVRPRLREHHFNQGNERSLVLAVFYPVIKTAEYIGINRIFTSRTGISCIEYANQVVTVNTFAWVLAVVAASDRTWDSVEQANDWINRAKVVFLAAVMIGTVARVKFQEIANLIDADELDSEPDEDVEAQGENEEDIVLLTKLYRESSILQQDLASLIEEAKESALAKTGNGKTSLLDGARAVSVCLKQFLNVEIDTNHSELTTSSSSTLPTVNAREESHTESMALLGEQTSSPASSTTSLTPIEKLIEQLDETLKRALENKKAAKKKPKAVNKSQMSVTDSGSDSDDFGWTGQLPEFEQHNPQQEKHVKNKKEEKGKQGEEPSSETSDNEQNDDIDTLPLLKTNKNNEREKGKESEETAEQIQQNKLKKLRLKLAKLKQLTSRWKKRRNRKKPRNYGSTVPQHLPTQDTIIHAQYYPGRTKTTEVGQGLIKGIKAQLTELMELTKKFCENYLNSNKSSTKPTISEAKTALSNIFKELDTNLDNINENLSKNHIIKDHIELLEMLHRRVAEDWQRNHGQKQFAEKKLISDLNTITGRINNLLMQFNAIVEPQPVRGIHPSPSSSSSSAAQPTRGRTKTFAEVLFASERDDDTETTFVPIRRDMSAKAKRELTRLREGGATRKTSAHFSSGDDEGEEKTEEWYELSLTESHALEEEEEEKEEESDEESQYEEEGELEKKDFNSLTSFKKYQEEPTSRRCVLF